MLTKARIIVSGVVQGVGYRALVMQAARFLGLKGLVRNIPDGKVEIFCEGPREKIVEFLKKIDWKAEQPSDFLSMNVKKIECYWEGEENYKPAWKPYEGFEIDYEVEKLSPFEKSSLEDHEFGKLYFVGFRNELKGFRDETRKSFGEMAEKYGEISKELKEFRKTIEKFLDEFITEFKRKRE